MKLTLWLIAILLSTNVYAGEDFVIKGAGTQKCSLYVGFIDKKSVKVNLFAGWLEGYLTAVNEYNENIYDITSFQSIRLIMKLVYAHCQSHSESSFYVVTKKLVQSFLPLSLNSKSELVVLAYNNKKIFSYVSILKKAKEKLKLLGYRVSSNEKILTKGDIKSIIKFQGENYIAMTGLPDEATLMKLFFYNVN